MYTHFVDSCKLVLNLQIPITTVSMRVCKTVGLKRRVLIFESHSLWPSMYRDKRACNGQTPKSLLLLNTTFTPTRMWHHNKSFGHHATISYIICSTLWSRSWSISINRQAICPYRCPEDTAQGNGCEPTHKSPQSVSQGRCMACPYCLPIVAADSLHRNILATTSDKQ